jgi:hypothetical protein
MRSEGSGVACLYSEALRRIQSSTQQQERTLQERQRSEEDRAAASTFLLLGAAKTACAVKTKGQGRTLASLSLSIITHFWMSYFWPPN